MKKDKVKKVVDFMDDMPDELKQLVMQTEICKEYLQAREKLGKMADKALKSGQSLGSDEILAESQKVDKLLSELTQKIEECKTKLVQDAPGK